MIWAFMLAFVGVLLTDLGIVVRDGWIWGGLGSACIVVALLLAERSGQRHR